VIIDCAAYVDGERVGAVAVDDVPEWLARGAFVWLGLRMPSADELAEVHRRFGIAGIDVDEALAPHTRAVLTATGSSLWLVLRTARYDDVREQVHLGELSVLVDDAYVITIRHGQASPLGGLRKELEVEHDRLRHGPRAVLAAIVGQVIADYGPALDGFERDVLEVEREVFAEEGARPVRRLYHLKRQVRDLLVAIEALQDPLHRLARRKETVADPEVHADLLEAADELTRVIHRARSLSDLITSALDANLTQVSLRQNEDMRRISAWVAIAAVPTMIAGVYGMNFEHFPELEWAWGYPLVLVVMATACTWLHRRFRRAGWL
jgi:magnesium transporter